MCNVYNIFKIQNTKRSHIYIYNHWIKIHRVGELTRVLAFSKSHYFICSLSIAETLSLLVDLFEQSFKYLLNCAKAGALNVK